MQLHIHKQCIFEVAKYPAFRAAWGMPKPFDFATEIKLARKEHNWTQAELAERASIASRTVVAVEKGTKPQRAIVIRLGYALNADIQKWLRNLKYSATSEEIDNIIRESGHLHFAGEKDPEFYVKDLYHRVESGKKMLMCICFLSAPGAASNPVIKSLVIESVRRGLSIAMICAYPPVPNHIRSLKPQLSLYHNEIYNRVAALALDIHEKISLDERKRVAVFVPDFSEADQRHLYIVPPPTGLSAYRPTLLLDLSKDKNDDSAYELALWLVMQQDQRDRWLPLFPAPSADAEAQVMSARVLQYWKDYFKEVINSFTSRGWDRSKIVKSGWRIDLPLDNHSV